MSPIYLYDPTTYFFAAKLIPDKQVTIYDDWMKERLTGGITVTREFKEKYKTGWRIYPTDASDLFAKAFKECYYVHGLQQAGYCWMEEREYEQALQIS